MGGERRAVPAARRPLVPVEWVQGWHLVPQRGADQADVVALTWMGQRHQLASAAYAGQVPTRFTRFLAGDCQPGSDQAGQQQ
jgi:hypothetical protein